jgi:hypothetical protein
VLNEIKQEGNNAKQEKDVNAKLLQFCIGERDAGFEAEF